VTVAWLRKNVLGNERIAVPAVIVCLFFYLVWDTGIHSDDYPFIQQLQLTSLRDVVFPAASSMTVLIFGPGSYYFDFFQYWGFGANFLAGYDLVKFVTLTLAAWFTYRFALDYLPASRALMATLLFLLYPIHDATVYWTATLVYALTPAVLMYSHYLIRHDRYAAGMATGLFGSFITYASPPYVFGLGLIFLAERAYKKAILFIAPGIIYLGYYFSVSRIQGASSGRISPDLTPSIFLKQYLVQVGSFFDAAVGPSFWLKIWYSASSITILSIVVLTVVLTIFWKWFKPDTQPIPRSLLLGLVAVLLLAFAMFALTGYYPQMAFNLGNRVMVYAALTLAFGLAMLPFGRMGHGVIAGVMLVSVLGLSDHWKAWNERQQQVFSAVRENADINALQSGDVLLVAGHAYSRLGPFAHIEFMSENYMAVALIRHALGREPNFRIHSINRRYRVQDVELVDSKYGERIRLPDRVAVYDAERNSLTHLPVTRLNAYLAALPSDNRHWAQLLGDGRLRTTLLMLMPRLKYLFES
jgi:hypothetical protein